MLTQTRHIIANLHESNIKFPSKVQDLTISHRALENVQDRVSVFICNHWSENYKELFHFSSGISSGKEER